jgi:hypothetical protein
VKQLGGLIVMNTRLTPIVLATLLCSGCTTVEDIAREEQKIPVTITNPGEPVKEAGALFLWPPHSSAAVVDKEGNRCVLVASGAKTIDASSEAALKVGKALEKIEGLDVATKTELVQTFTKLSAADARAAFVDVALFHLCILDQNGTFKDGDDGKSRMILDAYIRTIESGSGSVKSRQLGSDS